MRKSSFNLIRASAICLSVEIYFTVARLSASGLASKENSVLRPLNKAAGALSYNIFAPNNIQACIENNGILFFNPAFGESGLYWPKNSGKTAVFSAGIWLIGKSSLDGKLHSSSVDYQTEYQPGRILSQYGGDTNTVSSVASDPGDSSWNIMILSKTTPPSDPTYQLWTSGKVPGAPLTPDGKPEIIGEQAAYWVMNDLNLPGHSSTSTTAPMGLEVQNYFFGFDQNGALGNTLFMRMRIINKSTITYDSTYLGFFSDTDLGDGNDDYTGCDTTRDLGYVYNGLNSDFVYGVACPADGYEVLQGPRVPASPDDSARYNGVWVHGYRNLGMTAFAKLIGGGGVYGDVPLDSAGFSQQAYNLLHGTLKWSGLPYADSNGHHSIYVDPGDPVSGIGWLASVEQRSPSDVRTLVPSGPFTLAPGDTQEVVFAFVIGQGADRLSSITVMRSYADTARLVFDKDFEGVTTDVRRAQSPVPGMYVLTQNYPNPFNPSTSISFSIPQKGIVTLKVFDEIGREVSTLVSGEMNPGSYTVQWRAGNAPSGVYYCRLQAGSYSETKKLVLLR